MVSDALVQEIRERADILEVCGEFVRLKRSGKTYRGPCPLHGGEGPNFSVDPTRGIFKCFVCGEGGDVFAFVMRYEGVDFMSAARMLAERGGVRLELERAEPGPGHLEKDALYKLLNEASLAYRKCLLESPSAEEARAYLAGRDLGGPRRSAAAAPARGRPPAAGRRPRGTRSTPRSAGPSATPRTRPT